MVITSQFSAPLSYHDKKTGAVKQVEIKPGSRNYPMIDHKDPMVAEQLRVWKKHRKIGFDEILPEPVVENPFVPKEVFDGMKEKMEAAKEKADDRADKEPPKKARKSKKKRAPDPSGGSLPEQVPDGSPESGEMAE